MTSIQVKPNPDLDPKAWPLLKHPASGGLLDASGRVPADGRPWLNDGFTARLLTEGAIVRAEADAPGFTAWAADQMGDRQVIAPKPAMTPVPDQPPKPATQPAVPAASPAKAIDQAR